MSAPGNKVGHAELEIGDSVIMLADVEDVPPDEMEKRAAAAMPGAQA